MEKTQPLSAKLGEVRFRKKLVEQHLGRNNFFSGEPDQKEIIPVLKKRIDNSEKIFHSLKKRGFLLSPFLEIGAEKGQRSMILVNKFAAEGVALDLSLESLKSAQEFASLLNFSKLPILVCADAYHLPFADSTFPFIFCFETLHHFPDPTPIFKEIHRVLSPGGIFYFGEEPIKQTANLNLWRRGYHLTFWEKSLKFIGILPFLSKIGKTETGHGVLEEEFSLAVWKKGLSVFDKVETSVKPVFFGPSSSLAKKNNQWQNPNLCSRLLTMLEGGGIEGVAMKEKRGTSRQNSWRQFICPDCQKELKKDYCPTCRRQFEQKNKVYLLLPKKIQQSLYG